jgi:dTDP-4-dehydrorhamnose 3,5-epimerase
MKLIKTKLKDLLILKSNIFRDKRGFLRETFRESILKKKFPFDIMSYSKKNVLRGLHLQTKFRKLN